MRDWKYQHHVHTVAILLLAGGLIFFFARRTGQQAPDPSPTEEPDPTEPSDGGLLTPPVTKRPILESFPDMATQPSFVEPNPEVTPTRMDIADDAKTLNHPDSNATEDISTIDSIIRLYRRVYGNNPVAGLNDEVVHALKGNNPKRLILIDPDHPAINENGELVDRWGTPYFFHPVSKDLMEIRSAGPDRKLWSDDDVVLE